MLRELGDPQICWDKFLKHEDKADGPVDKDDCEDDDEQEEYEDQENEMMLMLMLMLMLMTMLLLLMMMMMMGARRWELGQQMFARVSMGEG